MTRKVLLFAGCIASLHAWGSCDKPVEVAAQSAVQVPDYSADEAPDSEQTAAQTAWRQYQDSISDALTHSPNPRDWALATLTAALKFDVLEADNKHTPDDLLDRARRAAPDDALVQWIAVNRGSTMHGAALQALHRLEPDNAAVWMDDLSAATKRENDAAIDDALAKMSASRRFDIHFVDLLKAATEIYLRNPVPDAYISAASRWDKPVSKDALPYVNAMALTASAALPAFQHLVNACRIDPASRRNGARAEDCAAIGRLMVANGDTLITNRLGAAVLRVSHTYTEEDIRRSRDVDWVYQQFSSALAASEDAAPDEYTSRFHDWVDTGSEVESMRRALLRKGIAPMPAPHWDDTWSLFSAERVQKDSEWFDKNPKPAK